MPRQMKYGVKTKDVKGRVEYYWAEIIRNLPKIDVQYKSESEIIRNALIHYLLNIIPKESIVKSYKLGIENNTIKEEDIEKMLHEKLETEKNLKIS